MNQALIKKEYKKNKSYSETGRKFGIPRQRVHQIITGYKTIALNKAIRKEHCEMCDRGGRMEIHHKDRNIENNKASNLITCCRRCHCILEKEAIGKFGTRSYQFRALRQGKSNKEIFDVKEKIIKRLVKQKWVIGDICVLFNTDNKKVIQGYADYNRA